MASTPLKLLLPLNRVSCSADCPAKVLNLFSPNQISSQTAVSLASSFFSPHNSKWAGPKRAQPHQRNLSPRLKWLCGCSRGDEDMNSWRNSVENETCMFGSDDETLSQVPTQAQSLVEGSGSLLVAEKNRIPDLDYLQELLAIQQQGPRAIGFFGTRNMGFMHQQLIEILSYAMVITQNHIYTSGASGTNAAVIRGALRAEKPELLTVILPQSLKMQSPESQELLAKVKNLIEKPYNDHLPLIEASRFDG